MNQIIIDGNIFEEKEVLKYGLRVIFKNGFGNRIIIEKPFKFENFNITMSGENNEIKINAGSYIKNTYIGLNLLANECKINIGKNFKCNGANISLINDGDVLSIGDNCELNGKIYLATQDGHTIFDINSLEICNEGQKIIIGNNVYLGYKTVVMKNVVLGNNIIVRPFSTITKSFENNNLLIAGHPAKIIRNNVMRKQCSIYEYKKRSLNE